MPLRTLLRDVFSQTPVGEWLEGEPSDAALRVNLLRRIRFATESKNDFGLWTILVDRIAEMFIERNQPSSNAETAVKLLLEQAFTTGSQPSAASRKLTREDLEETLQRAIPKHAAHAEIESLRELMRNQASSNERIAVGKLPSLFGIADRQSLVQEITSRKRLRPFIWIAGPNGVGKTTLAILLAQELGGNWLHCDLRPFASEGHEQAVFAPWRELVRSLNSDRGIAGVIIDDLSAGGADKLKVRLSGLVDMLAELGAVLIITSNHEPSGALRASLQLDAEAIVDAPYFSLEETRVLVSQSPSPESELIDAWAKAIHIFTSNGHPLLTVAKITKLRDRGWPQSALFEDVAPVGKSGLADARHEARLRLLGELTSSTSGKCFRAQVLYFNSLMANSFAN